MICLACQHTEVKRFGRDAKGQQRYRCLNCGRTFIDSSNRPLGKRRLPADRALQCLGMLLEGTSIRAIARLTGTDKETILGLIVDLGERCERFLRATVRSVPVKDVQCDELWAFVQCKERTRERLGKADIYGDCYCFTALERKTKLIVAWHVGKRSPEDTRRFANNLAAATSGHFQVTTDGYRPYRPILPQVFADRIDFATLVKSYTTVGEVEERRYSPPTVAAIEAKARWGTPDMGRVCTSHVERSNLSVRMGIRRLTRLTNAHSKSWRHHEAAMALWIAFYNFCRVHSTIKTTPAVASGLADRPWSLLELLQRSATF